MYKVGGFLFTFHGARSGESLLSDKKKIPVRQRAGNIMSQNFPTVSLAISGIAMKSDYLISWFATFSICTIFNISAKMRRVANLYVYLNLRR